MDNQLAFSGVSSHTITPFNCARHPTFSNVQCCTAAFCKLLNMMFMQKGDTFSSGQLREELRASIIVAKGSH